MQIFYLHGFASSARSSKAAFFAQKLAARGQTLHCPDFNEPDFSTLTITRMTGQVGHALEDVGEGPVALIGSSLGGFVAIQAAKRWPARVDRLVLLAPAVDLRPERLAELGNRTIEEWRATGTLNIFHFGYGRVMPLGYGLYTDAEQHDAMNVPLDLPIQVFQGLRDTAVNPQTVERWSAARPNVELHMLNDDHQLLGSLEDIWARTEPFLLQEPGD
ncbi:alpha/beta fold hydrolase [soil metagenome]|nr:alpha/beta fold hydrolase [Acidobacteriota bacterium]